MKPGDHPEFFRLPPPPGRSRESEIVLDPQGRFWNAGVLVDHEAMAVAFASWIRRHPDDGRLILTNGYDWTYFTARDAPFFVRRVDVTAGGERAVLRLFDGTEEDLDPQSLEVSPEGVLFTRVKAGALEARFLPAAQLDLVDLVVEGPDGSPWIQVRETRFPIRPRQLGPGS